MVGKTQPANRADRNRFDIIKRHTGCLACLIEGFENGQAEVHHLTSGFRREGHQATIGLCCWHHRGIPPTMEMTRTTARYEFGPAFSDGRRPFAARYGEDSLLLELQDFAIQLYCLSPWVEQAMPREVGQEIRKKWRGLWAAG